LPKLIDNLEQHNLTTSHYGFSATKLENLGATEYTLATIVVDTSPSTHHFIDEMEKVCKAILKSCKYSPRADNLMMRTFQFNSGLSEVHGFKLLSEINESDYSNVLRPAGLTALYDATENAVSATGKYAEDLYNSDYMANGILFVITDGMDNQSTTTRKMIKDALQKISRDEKLESFVTILIGVNITDPTVARYLDEFNKEVGFTQYVELKDADAKTLAKLANFVSKSISAASQSLGTGGPSQSLSF